MPRIYNSLSDAIDLCKRCFPKSEETARKKYGNEGDGPDDRGNCFSYDEVHPDYEDEDYECDQCGNLLGKNDN